jgi:hypothetical protein
LARTICYGGEIGMLKDNELLRLIEDYVTSDIEKKKIERKQSHIKDQVKKLLQQPSEFKMECSIGLATAIWSQFVVERFDSKSFQKDYAELYAKYKITSEQERITINIKV